MKVHEYQAKEIFARYGVPVPKGQVASSPEEAMAAAEVLGGRAAVKAQVHAGGRGQAGGIKLVSSPQEAAEVARQLIGTRLVTHQTGPEGVPVLRVLVEEILETARELYLGIVIDSQAKMPVIMVSEAGGMAIEEIAAAAPDRIIKAWVDPVMEYQASAGRRLAYRMGLNADLIRPAADLIGGVYKVFTALDCSLAEVNPLIVTTDDRLLAADAKLNFDDNAMFRQKQVAAMRDTSQEDPLEVEATASGVGAYIKLSGTIGCVVNGAGLAMATLDTIKLYGGEAANFLDIGTVNNPERVVSAMRILTKDPDVKTVYFNIFGGAARVDVIALGLVEAHKQFAVAVPLVARLAGNGLEEGRKILADNGIKVIEAEDMADGARKAVAAAADNR